MGGMIGVIYPQTLVPHNKDGDSGLLREVDAVPCASGSVALWVIGERKAEISSQLNHLLVADGASGSAVLLPVGSMDLSLEIEQVLSVESGFGVCACRTAMDDDGEFLCLVDDVLYSEAQGVGIVWRPLVRTGTSDEQARCGRHGGYSKQKRKNRERGGEMGGNLYDSRHTVVCLSIDKPVLAVVVTHCIVSDDFIGGDNGEVYQMRER